MTGDHREALRAEYDALAARNRNGNTADENQRARERMVEIRARIEALDDAGMTLARWRALTDDQRQELAQICCRGCGSLDAGCRCWDDS